MKGALWSVVAALVIVLQVAADIPIQPNVDIQKLAGKWCAQAVVVNEGEVTNSLRFRANMEVNENGNLTVTKVFPKATECKDIRISLKPSDQPGKFITAIQSNTLNVVETDYDDYCIFHVKTASQNELHLYTREKTVSNAAGQKFKAAATSLNFNNDKIVYRTETGPCPNA